MKIHYGNKTDESHEGSIALVEVECYTCGKKYQKEEARAKKNSRHFCSSQCLTEWRSEYLSDKFEGRSLPTIEGVTRPEEVVEKMRGPNNPNWKEGDPHPRPDLYGEEWGGKRKAVLERDGECQVCGEDEGLLDVHHIVSVHKFDGPQQANSMDNLILLCRSCHMKVEHGELACPSI